jgi:hypothetical protein
LLRVSRRSSRSPLRAPARVSEISILSSGVGVVPALSLPRDTLLRGVRPDDREDERDLERDSRRDLRDLGGGEGLMDADVVDLLRLDGRGEREGEDEGVGDLRRAPRSGLLPRPRPPRPLYVVPRRSTDLDLRLRGAGERDPEGDRSLRRGGERDSDSDRAGVADAEFDIDDLLRSSRLRPPRSLGTYVSDSLGGGARNDSLSLELRRRGDLEYRGPLRSNPLPP